MTTARAISPRGTRAASANDTKNDTPRYRTPRPAGPALRPPARQRSRVRCRRQAATPLWALSVAREARVGVDHGWARDGGGELEDVVAVDAERDLARVHGA